MLWCRCSVARSCLTLWAHALRHTIPCPSLSPGVCLNSCPLSQWCYLTISCSAALFFCHQSFPASGSFPVSQLFTSGEDFPVAQMVKCLSTMRETWVRSLGWEGLLEKEMEPTPVFLPGKSHGWRSLVGYSPWGCKELDTAEQLHFLYFHIRWPNDWRFGTSPFNEYSRFISFRSDWFDLLAVQGTLKSLFQHHTLKASILQRSAFFIRIWHDY